MASNIETQYCSHCGSNGNLVTKQTKPYHEKCYSHWLSRCNDVVTHFSKHSVSKNIQVMALNVKYLYGIMKPTDKDRREKKTQRSLKLRELLDFVSALQNSNGGHLLIQMVGMAKKEAYTGAFDEFADKSLYEMIGDGSFFDKSFKKTWLKNDPDEKLKKYSEFLVLYVEKGSYFSTSDFKTKLALDFSLQIPLPSTIRRFVVKEPEADDQEPVFRNERPFIIDRSNHSNLQNLQECRTLQLKSAPQEESTSSSKEFGHKIWTELRLQEYISAFTKNAEGGSYILGIGETIIESTSKYKTKVNDIQGFHHQNTSELKKVLEEMIRDELRYLSFDETAKPLSAYVKIQFIRVNHNKNLMEVAVSPAHGIVFYDKNGPESYIITPNNELERIDVQRWLEAMRKQ